MRVWCSGKRTATIVLAALPSAARASFHERWASTRAPRPTWADVVRGICWRGRTSGRLCRRRFSDHLCSPLEARIAMDPRTFDSASMPTTKIECLIKRIDRSIASLETNTSPLDQVNWCKLRSAWRERHRLGLLLLARKIECRRAVISLNRWRYGFEVEALSLASTGHAVAEAWRKGAFAVIPGERA